MITENLRVNQLSASAYEDYLRYLTALDAKDIESYATYLSNGVSITFGNSPAVSGKDAVVGMLRGYWQSFASIEHDLLNIYGSDDSYVLEAFNHYERHDGKKVTVRAVAFTDKDESGLVCSIRVFGDTSALFER